MHREAPPSSWENALGEALSSSPKAGDSTNIHTCNSRNQRGHRAKWRLRILVRQNGSSRPYPMPTPHQLPSSPTWIETVTSHTAAQDCFDQASRATSTFTCVLQAQYLH